MKQSKRKKPEIKRATQAKIHNKTHQKFRQFAACRRENTKEDVVKSSEEEVARVKQSEKCNCQYRTLVSYYYIALRFFCLFFFW